MTEFAQLDRNVTFRQRALVCTVRSGAWQDIVTRAAYIKSLKGTEVVQASRMAGRQPVVIFIRRDSLTKTIDNAWSAIDARDPTIIWDITSKIISDDLEWVEAQAIQRLGGDDEE